MTKGLLLKRDTVIDTAVNAAPSSAKKSSGEGDPEMHQTKKINQWHHGGECARHHASPHAAAGTGSWCICRLGLPGRGEIQEHKHQPNWYVAMMPSKRKALEVTTPMDAILVQLEKTKASMRAKVEHPFRDIGKFGYVKVKYWGLAKNTVNLMLLFAQLQSAQQR